MPGAYPIVITTWIVAYGNYRAAGKDLAGVKQMLNYVYTPAAQNKLAGLGYAPLPANLVVAGRRSRSPSSSSFTPLTRRSPPAPCSVRRHDAPR